MSGPRLPVNHLNGSNRRPNNNLSRMPSAEKPHCAQHDDLIKYIFESWDKVFRELNNHRDNVSGGHMSSSVEYYQEREPNPLLKDFKAFDLEAYWDRRVDTDFNKQAQHS